MQEELSPGTLVAGQYVVERRVRRRPLATVYTAHHQGRADGQFHVWQLKGVRVTDDDTVKRFLAVMARVQLLSNPSIPAVLDHAMHAGGPVVITERMPEPTLRERIAGGLRLQRPDVIHLVRAVASVVDELHGCEPPVVHRALSPDDIVLGDHEGQCWVEACGFAHALTVSGMAGDPSPSFVEVPYRSPDELSSTVEPRTDLFVLASIVFECLTGERAFQGDDAAAVADAIRRGARPSVCDLRPELSPEVDPILFRAWSTDFSNGYATAWSFARDLTEALSAVPSARVKPRRQGRPGASVAPSARANARPALADAPDESSVVMPAPDLRARMPAAVPNEDEVDRAFDLLLGPDDPPQPRLGDTLVAGVPDLSDPDDEDGRPTEVFAPKPVPRTPRRDTPPSSPASHFAPAPPRRPPTPARGTAASVNAPGTVGSALRAVSQPGFQPATAPTAAPVADTGALTPPPRRSVPPPAPDPAARSAVRSPTPPSIAPGPLRGQTPTPSPAGVSSMRPATPVHVGRVTDVNTAPPVGVVPLGSAAQRTRPATQPALRVVDLSGVQQPVARNELALARPTARPPAAPVADTQGFPGGDRSPVKILSQPAAPVSAAASRATPQTRAAWILGMAMIAAAAIFTAGQYYVASIARSNANPVLAPPRISDTVRGPTDPGGGTLPRPPSLEGGTPNGSGPDSADLGAVRSRLESVVRLCVAHPPPAHAIRLSVRYLGATGHAVDVRIAEPFSRLPSAECVDRATRGIDLSTFGARDYTADYVFDVE